MENEKKKPLYRIKVEKIEAGEDGNETLSIEKEIECDGFVIMGNHADECVTYIGEVSIDDIANMIVSDYHLYPASLLAKGMYESRKAHGEMLREQSMDKIMKKIADIANPHFDKEK